MSLIVAKVHTNLEKKQDSHCVFYVTLELTKLQTHVLCLSWGL